jgi:GAF domain-containing protein
MSRSSLRATAEIPNGEGRPTNSPPGLPDPDVLADLGEPEIDALQVLSRAMHVKEADLPKTLTAVLSSATAVIPSARDSGLNLFTRGRFEPQATLGAAPPLLDAVQQRLGSGPCIEASRDQVTVTIEDMATDTRWPEFASTAVDSAVHAMLCVPLWVNDEVLGSLSLYAATPRAFEPPAIRLAELYATHAALALAGARRVDQLRRAMVNRDVIGQAKGVLMERHRITAEQAFTVLKEASRKTERRVVEVAEILATTGVLPGN